jgi:predicted nucleic acid-binding protein
LRPLDVARLRAVVDTSSLVRAALNADSAAGRLIERLLSGDSDSELVNVLERPKFRQRLAQEYRRRFLLYLQATAFFVVPEQRRGLSRSRRQRGA